MLLDLGNQQEKSRELGACYGLVQSLPEGRAWGEGLWAGAMQQWWSEAGGGLRKGVKMGGDAFAGAMICTHQQTYTETLQVILSLRTGTFPS